MSAGSDARAALRSYLPERYLIYRGDAQALFYKYKIMLNEEVGVEDRQETLRDIDCWEADEADYSLRHRRTKYFDGLHIEKRRSPVIAKDKANKAKLSYDEKKIALLHITRVDGIHHLRHQLGVVATYVEVNEKMRKADYIAGVTYSEMARLGVLLGFREMKVKEMDKGYELDITAMHMAFCAINGRTADFQPAVVYLPTDEFLQKFLPKPER